MKTSFFLIFTAIIVSVCCSPSTAQDHTQFSLPEGAKARLGKGTLGEVQFSPDGNWLAVSSSVGIWFYDPKTGKELDLLPQTDCASAFAFAYAPDGSKIVRASDDSKSQVLDVPTKKRIGILAKYGRRINAVAYSPDGSTIMSGNSDGAVRAWDAETYQRRGTLKAHTGAVNAVVYSPDGTIIATAGDWKDKNVQLWDADTGKHRVTLKHKDQVYAIAYAPDGNTIATANADKTVWLWDADTGIHKTMLKGHTDRVTSVIYSPDGNTIISASRDKTIRLWDVNTGIHKATLKGHTDRVTSVAYSPDGNIIATASGGRYNDDNTVRLWDANTGETKVILTGYNRINSVTHAPDGDIIVSEGTWLPVPVSAEPRHISPDGRTIAIAGSLHTVQLLDARTGKRKATLKHTNYIDWIYMMITDREYGIEAIAFSPDGNTIVTGGGYYTNDEGTVSLWHTRTRKRKIIYKGPGYVSSVAFSPDGRTIAAGDWDSKIRLWNAVTGKELQTIRTRHKGGVLSLMYSPNGNTIATGGGYGDNTVRLFDADTGKLKTTLKRPIEDVNCIAYSPDGNTIVTGTRNGNVQVWEATGQHKTTFTGHTVVTSVVCSHDGKTIASGNKDGTVILWKIPPTPMGE
ncbi:hypothetical protein C6503_27090 [Candidatus Poribacteria bacterium]|nr:MAG: hypothetical protein C6503_27090 [Candidatus Poribacteria bacterium]